MQETRLTRGHGVPAHVSAAAENVFQAGGSPRAQIDAAREAAGKKLVYLPHQSSRERERRLRRAGKAAAQA